ncbi:MAG: hypothetical protein WCA22_15320 [Candidatus Binatus sp.]
MQSIKRFFVGLFREMAPVVLFFFIAFLLIGLMFKLFVSQYEIEFSAFAKAAVAALIIGKVVALLNWAESGHNADNTHRRIVVVACKTFLYALVVIVLGIGEKIFHAYREAGSLGEAVSNLIANANVDRFMGLVLLISLVVFVYLVMQEIERAMGEGALYRLFFKRPSPDRLPRTS